MSNIHLKKIDEVFMEVQCDTSVARKLHEAFSFFVDGYKHSPQFKYGVWDGRISMFKNGIMYTGLIMNVIDFAREREYTVTVDDGLKRSIKYDPTWIAKQTFKYTPKDYQIKYFESAIKANKLLALSPTASGKSFMIYLIVRYLLDHSFKNILITTPNISLCDQLLGDFVDYTVDGFDVKRECAVIHSQASNKTKKAVTNPRVTITTWQSAVKYGEDKLASFDAYICDEAHLASSESLTYIINSLTRTAFRFGFTGTLKDSALHELELQGRFGKVIRFVTTRELIDSGQLAPCMIDCRVITYDNNRRKEMRKCDYHGEIKQLINDAARNRYIVDLAMQGGEKNTLVLFNLIEGHGVKLYDEACSRMNQNLKVCHFVSGDVCAEERERIRHEVENVVPKFKVVTLESGLSFNLSDRASTFGSLKVGTVVDHNIARDIEAHGYKVNCLNERITQVDEVNGAHVIFASYGTYSTGINLKRLNRLILAHPLKTQIRLLQSIGRLLRQMQNKGAVTVIDVADDLQAHGRTVTHPNHTYRHFMKRLEIYEESGFPYSINEVPYETL